MATKKQQEKNGISHKMEMGEAQILAIFVYSVFFFSCSSLNTDFREKEQKYSQCVNKI